MEYFVKRREQWRMQKEMEAKQRIGDCRAKNLYSLWAQWKRDVEVAKKRRKEEKRRTSAAGTQGGRAS